MKKYSFFLLLAGIAPFCLYTKPKQTTKSTKKSHHVFVVSPDNFGKITHSHLPVVLDVFAPWCPPCTRMTPIFNEISLIFTKSIRSAKIMIDNFDDSDPTISFLKKTYNVSISCVPTFLFIKNNKVVEQLEGSMDLLSFKNKINSFLKSSK